MAEQSLEPVTGAGSSDRVESEDALLEADFLSTPEAGPAAVRGGRAAHRLGYAAASLLALGTGALLYRHLGVVDSGRYTAAGSLVALVAALRTSGLTAIGLRELAIRTGAGACAWPARCSGLRLLIDLAGVLVRHGLRADRLRTSLGVGVCSRAPGWLVFTRLAEHARDAADGRLAPRLDLAAGIPAPAAAVAADRRARVAGAGLLAFLAAADSRGAGRALPITPCRVSRAGADAHPLRARRVARAASRRCSPTPPPSRRAAIYFRVAILLVSVLSSGQQLGYFGLSFNVMAALFAIPAMLVSVAFPIFSRAARDDHGCASAYALSSACSKSR